MTLAERPHRTKTQPLIEAENDTAPTNYAPPKEKRNKLRGFGFDTARASNGNATRVGQPLHIATWIYESIRTQHLNEVISSGATPDKLNETQPVGPHVSEYDIEEPEEDTLFQERAEVVKPKVNQGEFVNPADAEGEKILQNIRAVHDYELLNEMMLLSINPHDQAALGRKKDIEKKKALFEKIMGSARGFSLFVYGRYPEKPKEVGLQSAANIEERPGLVPQCVFNTFPGKNGGTGVIWFGWDLVLDRPVAIKALDAEFAKSSDFQQLLIKEGQTLASFGNAHVMYIYDMVFHHDSKNPYLILEYLDSDEWSTLKNFRDLKKDKHEEIAKKEVHSIVEQMGIIFSILKNRGITHRDWKLSNLFIFKAAQQDKLHLKMGDFGSSSSIAEDDEVWGTPEYNPPDFMNSAPEPGLGKSGRRPEDDIFSVGVVILELLGEAGYYQSIHHEKIKAEAARIMINPYRIDDAKRYPTLNQWVNIHITNPLKKRVFFAAMQQALSPLREDRFSNEEEFFELLEFALS